MVESLGMAAVVWDYEGFVGSSGFEPYVVQSELFPLLISIMESRDISI